MDIRARARDEYMRLKENKDSSGMHGSSSRQQ